MIGGDNMNYVLYYPEEGRYSRPLHYPEAKYLSFQFPHALIVDLRTGEVLN